MKERNQKDEALEAARTFYAQEVFRGTGKDALNLAFAMISYYDLAGDDAVSALQAKLK